MERTNIRNNKYPTQTSKTSDHRPEDIDLCASKRPNLTGCAQRDKQSCTARRTHAGISAAAILARSRTDKQVSHRAPQLQKSTFLTINSHRGDINNCLNCPHSGVAGHFTSSACPREGQAVDKSVCRLHPRLLRRVAPTGTDNNTASSGQGFGVLRVHFRTRSAEGSCLLRHDVQL